MKTFLKAVALRDGVSAPGTVDPLPLYDFYLPFTFLLKHFHTYLPPLDYNVFKNRMDVIHDPICKSEMSGEWINE